MTQYPLCGYQIFDIQKVDHKWRCIFCGLVIKEPIQLTECGHRACKGCFETRAASATNDTLTCPVDECKITFHKQEVMPDRAFKREIDEFQIVCFHKTDENCAWVGRLKFYQEHLDQTHIHYICPSCSEQLPSNDTLENHLAKRCPAIFQHCPLGAVCTLEMFRKEELEQHLRSEKHQETIALILSGKCEIQQALDQDQTMDTDAEAQGLEQTASVKLTELAEKVQKLNEDTLQLSQEFIKLNEIYSQTNQDIVNFQRANSERNKLLSKLQPKQKEIETKMEQLKQNIHAKQYVSTDGTLMWYVDRVSERLADAQSERQTSILSPVFFSSPTGYKMRARLYLNGDGTAKRTHMSLFFMLMKGEYDALLSWPFGFKVNFCLFDQTGGNRHVIDSFRPDIKSSSFQRPQNESNIASGIPKFFPLPMILQDDNPYVRDDVLFLKIIVDLHDTPKLILPYMLTLNPGLPFHVQQTMINQEKAKYNQQQANLNASTPMLATPMNTCG